MKPRIQQFLHWVRALDLDLYGLLGACLFILIYVIVVQLDCILEGACYGPW